MGRDPNDRFFDPEEYQVAVRMGAFNKKPLNPIEQFQDFIINFSFVKPSKDTCQAFIRNCIKLTRHGIALDSPEVMEAIEAAFRKLETMASMVEMNPHKE
jgi:hypothetical protein